jgi:hypothetical protein
MVSTNDGQGSHVQWRVPPVPRLGPVIARTSTTRFPIPLLPNFQRKIPILPNQLEIRAVGSHQQRPIRPRAGGPGLKSAAQAQMMGAPGPRNWDRG